ERGEYDAIVLAAAGLRRLGLEKHISERLPADVFPPAVSQGAIGVCVRTDDAEASRWLRKLGEQVAQDLLSKGAAKLMAEERERAKVTPFVSGPEAPQASSGNELWRRVEEP